jgi:septum formation protein
VTTLDRQDNAPGTHLVLGSGSPRRKDLLERAGFRFSIDPAGIDEDVEAGESALDATTRLATEKALAVAARGRGNAVVLGADTSVVLDGELLGKPRDRDDAARMLLRLAGRDHVVLTAWALLEAPGDARAVVGVSRSVVTMREVSAAEARVYADGGEPLDKAGSYAVQGEGKRFVGAVFGSLDNVIGLPVEELSRALRGFGIFPECSGP